MDALPVRENTGLPYASTLTAVDDAGNTVGVAHACGHDAHVTCLLGAAELLAQAPQSWGGTFIALLQPAEEVAGGAKAMMDGGLRDRIPKPDVAFAQHVLAYPAGKIGTQAGPVLSAGDSISYDMSVRQRMIDSIERMVKAECEASGSPRPPEFDYFDQYPLTDNNAEVTERITSAFRSHFGAETVFDLERQTASEDFSNIPNGFGTPYTYWGVGGTDPEKYQRALDAGRVEQDIPVNHSEFFAPVIEPTLSHGTEALVVAALTYLAK